MAEISIKDIAQRLEHHCENFQEAVDLATKLAYSDTPELTKLLEDVTGISEDSNKLVDGIDFQISLEEE